MMSLIDNRQRATGQEDTMGFVIAVLVVVILVLVIMKLT
jgi:hypothetical protein